MARSCSFTYGRVLVLLVSSADVAHDVMKTHDLKFANRPRIKAVEMLLFPPTTNYGRQMKSLFTVHLLSKKMVRSFKNIREEEVKSVVEKLEKASSSSLPVNLSELLLNMSSNVVCRITLGRKYGQEENTRDFRSQMRKVIELVGVFPVGDYISGLAWIDKFRGLDRKMKEASKPFLEFIEKVVQEHVDEGENNKETSDFVYTLLQIQKEKINGLVIDRSDIRGIILDTFFGGGTTTFTTLDWAMMFLVRHPESMKKVQDEIKTYSRHKSYESEEETENMKYLKAVITEVLRLHPPGPLLIPRQLSEDVKLKGYDISKGTQVLINAWEIQRDTAAWGLDADEFKPERHLDRPCNFLGQDFNLIPFGSGRRLCPGIGFAMALIEVALANLVNRFNWRVEMRPLGDDDEYYLAETTGIEVCRKFPLIVFPSSALSTV